MSNDKEKRGRKAVYMPNPNDPLGLRDGGRKVILVERTSDNKIVRKGTA